MIDFMFDTNIFDYMIDKQINPAEATRKGTIWVANVQFSEIENVPDLQRRQQLQNMLNLVRPQKLMLESGIWCDKLLWDDEQPWHDNSTTAFRNVLGRSKAFMDAFIADVAERDNLTLVSNDVHFRKCAARACVNTIDAKAFFTR